MSAEDGGETDGRKPSLQKPAAIEAIDVLPAFFRMRGRKALVYGDGPGAAWKAELLEASGAALTIYAPAPSQELNDFLLRRQAVRLERRPPSAEDLAGVFLAVVDSEIAQEIERVRALARQAGVLLNVVDKPDYCDFSFGSIVNRSPLVIGVSTDGAAPVLGQAVRSRIEAILPGNIGDWTGLAERLRTSIADRRLSFRQRRSFWEYFVGRATSGAKIPRDDVEVSALLDQGLRTSAEARGRIILVGAGPGDPDLLTFKAVRALQSADVVLFDDLAPARVLELARREAQRVSVGKRGHSPSVGQSDISSLLVKLGLEGKTVVRLKGGDPSVFGRANEELNAARAAGIPCEIVPGVTAALAAAAAVGASLSERERARRIQFITAHAADGALPKSMEWRALVDRDATTAVYMGVKTLPALVARLLQEGIDPATPAVVVENASLPNERHFAATISGMPSVVAAAAPSGPCLLLYGQTLDHALSVARAEAP